MPGTPDSGPRTSTAGDGYLIRDGEREVQVRKVFTRMGERLDLTDVPTGDSVRLDAIMLESVTWQPASELTERAEALLEDQTGPVDETRIESAGRVGGDREDPDTLTVSNEYALAELRTVVDEGRELLSVRAPKLGYATRLGAGELAWLAHQDHETFTEWLETPFGPEEDHH